MFNNIRNYINDGSWKINIFNNKVNIVNLIDVISLEEDRVSVRCEELLIVIKGDNLSVNKMLDKEILVTGTIKSIEFNK